MLLVVLSLSTKKREESLAGGLRVEKAVLNALALLGDGMLLFGRKMGQYLEPRRFGTLHARQHAAGRVMHAEALSLSLVVLP